MKAHLEQRREKSRERRSKTFREDEVSNGVPITLLNLNAFGKLVARLEAFGNILSERQREALFELVGRYTLLAGGKTPGRHAFPLATGLGKTQSIVAWIATVHEMGLEHISVAVCQSQVEALCTLKRELMEAGVPEEKIGLLHSYGKHGASLPSTEDNDTRPYLLCTHARVMGKGGVEEFNQYLSHERNLLIWDESLLKSRGRSLSHIEVDSALGWAERRYKLKEGAGECLAYLQAAVDLFTQEKGRQEQGHKPEPIALPELTSEELDQYKLILGSNPVVEPLHDLLDASQQPLRVVSLSQGGGAWIQYDLVVPAELQNIVILDASQPIRELCKMDKTILKEAAYSRGVVTYENVTFHQLKHSAGRGGITEAFNQKAHERYLSKEIAQVVKSIPEEQGVILFTFLTHKGAKIDLTNILKQDLVRAGFDLQAKLPDGKERFVWLTWGNETSLSQYSYCENVIMVGILHRSLMDLSASVIGQKEDIQAEIEETTLKDIEASEVAHCVYQGASRASCRTLTMGKANPTKVWLVYPRNGLEERVRQVMPGVQWMTWEPSFIPVKGKIENHSKVIEDYLSRFEMESISAVQLKKETGLTDVPNRTFSEARKLALSRLPEWNYEGRSFVYKSIWITDRVVAAD